MYDMSLYLCSTQLREFYLFFMHYILIRYATTFHSVHPDFVFYNTLSLVLFYLQLKSNLAFKPFACKSYRYAS